MQQDPLTNLLQLVAMGISHGSPGGLHTARFCPDHAPIPVAQGDGWNAVFVTTAPGFESCSLCHPIL